MKNKGNVKMIRVSHKNATIYPLTHDTSTLLNLELKLN